MRGVRVSAVATVLAVCLVFLSGCGYYEDIDDDGDGAGEKKMGAFGVTPASNASANNKDCSDGDASVNTKATEDPRRDEDENCDGYAEFLEATDNDGDRHFSKTTRLGRVETKSPHNVTWKDPATSTWTKDPVLSDIAKATWSGTHVFNNMGAVKTAMAAFSGHDYSGPGTDCDDSREDVHPGASEVFPLPPDDFDDPEDDVYQSLDENCNGVVGSLKFRDEDGDHYGVSLTFRHDGEPTGWSDNADDCDDATADVNPIAFESYGNDVDENCNAYVGTEWSLDLDGDTFGGGARIQVDSKDQEPATGVQNDDDCNDADAAVNPNTLWYVDADGDGWAPAPTLACNSPGTGFGTKTIQGVDCDDSAAKIHPRATETAGNGVDEDCAGEDQTKSGRGGSVKPTYYEDDDGDGFGNPAVPEKARGAPPGFVENDLDCDDTDADVNPDATEVPDNLVDDDCAGGDATGGGGATTYYADTDTDGFGDPDDSVVDTEEPLGYVDNADDCDDTDIAINPAAAEIEDDGIDQDCTGDDLINWFADLDGDFFGDPLAALGAFEVQPATSIDNSDDCDDGDADAFPGSAPNDGAGCYKDADDDDYGDALAVAPVLTGTDCDDDDGTTPVPTACL